MKEVVLKVFSLGKVERARPRAEVPMGVGDPVRILFELSANTAGGAMGVKIEPVFPKAKIPR